MNEYRKKKNGLGKGNTNTRNDIGTLQIKLRIKEKTFRIGHIISC